MQIVGLLLLLLAVAGFLVVDGFAGAAYHLLGIPESGGRWLEMASLVIAVAALMGALKIAEAGFERERRRDP